MTARDPHIEFDRDVATESDTEGVDSQQLKETLGFIWRAPRRRPLLAITVFVVIAALGLTISMTMPRAYNAEVKLLAQHDLVLPALSNPGRTVPAEADNPTRNAASIIMQRDNLVALVNEAHLLAKWRASRSPALRLKDKFFALLSGPPREEDQLQTLVQTLEKKMTVTSDDNTVTISIDWSDPHQAYEIVKIVQKNFVDANYDSDVRMVQDAIGVLEQHAKSELEQVDSALAAYQALLVSEAPAPAPATSAAPDTAPTTVQRAVAPAVAAQAVQSPPAPTPADSDLTRALEEKRRQIRALEDERDRSLEAIRQQLMQAQLTLTPMHPTVIALKQRLDTLNVPPAELAALKNEERVLMAQIAPIPAASSSAHPMVPGIGAVEVRRPIALPTEGKSAYLDQRLAPAHSKLDAAIYRYQDIMARIDGAKLELDIKRTAFRYRFSVITPAEVPRSPKKPIAVLVGIASVLAAFVLAFLAAAAADWRAGRFLETWQIRRRLKIDVLGELEPPL